MNTQITMSAPQKQTGAVVTLEAMLLTLVGVVMAIGYSIIVYDALAYMISALVALTNIFEALAASFLDNLCTAILASNPAPAVDPCNTTNAFIQPSASTLIAVFPDVLP